MSTIQELSPEIIAKIAAGEVIERPMYVVKELVENSLDAQATLITIELSEGGMERIRITDNGHGMSPTDLLLSTQRYTTSKTDYDQNLLGIHTLGFRGEALYSIATVSQLTINSRLTNAESGYQIENLANSIAEIKPIGMPTGTQVVVEQLFHTLPARKKFLKSAQHELKYITDIVTQYALAYPNVGFTLTHNKRQVLNLPTQQPLAYRLKSLLGETLYENLIPIEHHTPYLTITGFLSKPQMTARTTTKSWWIVNQRAVKDKQLTNLVKQTYGTLLEPHTYPIFLLALQLPPELVDVNVHPRKEEVKYLNQPFVHQALTDALIHTLTTHNLTYQDARWRTSLPNSRPQPLHAGSTNTYAAQLLKEEILPWQQTALARIKRSSPVIQLHDLYLITETTRGILILDQHAAHERILYEQFRTLYQQKTHEHPTVELPQPAQLHLSLQESQMLELNQSLFQALGFSIEEFGPQTYQVRTVPALLQDRPLDQLIREVIDDLLEERTLGDIDSTTNKMLSYLACRSAIKAGDQLTQAQAKEIITHLDLFNTLYTCPHGRPLKIELSLKELSRLFKRT